MKFFLILLFSFLGCSSSEIKSQEGVNPSNSQECFISSSELKSWSSVLKKQYLTNPSYDVIYDNENIEPFIVIYQLKYSDQTHYLKRDSDYNNRFKPDKRVIKSANDSDYKKSGWDKGHLAPAKDFSYEVSAAESTFLLSNIAPQNPYFNRNGAWKKLEEKVREISQNSERPIQIVSGPIVVQNKRINEIDTAPTVPDYFFKTIIQKEGDNCTYTSFVFKNNSSSIDFCKDKSQSDLVPNVVKSHLKDSGAKEHDICN